ncbi:MAG: hypothetical protein COA78_22140 [Blastopirellula sp.]|nr:MAG: hypothetical protein COA78_22140 [Blastopirellula sp.]
MTKTIKVKSTDGIKFSAHVIVNSNGEFWVTAYKNFVAIADNAKMFDTLRSAKDALLNAPTGSEIKVLKFV